MVRTPSGYVRQSPWMSVANKQLELMGCYMAELGITPAVRCRVAARSDGSDYPTLVQRVIVQWVGPKRDGASTDAAALSGPTH